MTSRAAAAGGMGGTASGSRWATNVGLFVTVVAVGAALSFFFPATTGSAGNLTAALVINLFLLVLAIGGVNVINAGVYLTGGGRCSVVSKAAAFARRNVAVLCVVAGTSSAVTGAIVFAGANPVLFVCFVLLVAMSTLVVVSGLGRGTR